VQRVKASQLAHHVAVAPLEIDAVHLGRDDREAEGTATSAPESIATPTALVTLVARRATWRASR
jgi:hypothetical protein